MSTDIVQTPFGRLYVIPNGFNTLMLTYNSGNIRIGLLPIVVNGVSYYITARMKLDKVWEFDSNPYFVRVEDCSKNPSESAKKKVLESLLAVAKTYYETNKEKFTIIGNIHLDRDIEKLESDIEEHKIAISNLTKQLTELKQKLLGDAQTDT